MGTSRVGFLSRNLQYQTSTTSTRKATLLLHTLEARTISLGAAARPPPKTGILAGGFFPDEPHTLGRVLDGLRTASGSKKLKKSFLKAAEMGADMRRICIVSRPCDFGAAPCFLFGERAEKEI